LQIFYLFLGKTNSLSLPRSTENTALTISTIFRPSAAKKVERLAKTQSGWFRGKLYNRISIWLLGIRKKNRRKGFEGWNGAFPNIFRHTDRPENVEFLDVDK